MLQFPTAMSETTPPFASEVASASPGVDSFARAALFLFLAAVFLRADSAPIHHLDTWSHWKYGEWIWHHGALPTREPFSPYSDGRVPVVDVYWLGQLLCFGVYTKTGVEGIALLYAVLEVLKYGLYYWAYRKASHSSLLAVLGIVGMYVGRWSYFGVFRPQVFGEVFWAAVLVAAARPSFSRGAVWLVPLCVMAWANFHGSFLLVYVLLAILLVGRSLEQVAIHKKLSAAIENPDAKRTVLILLLSFAAACVNPYGPRLLLETARFSNYPILEQIKEWQPLVPFSSFESTALIVSVFLTLFTVRLSPKRVTVTECMLLGAFGLSAWFAARMVPWWMTICPFVLLPHWHAIARQWLGNEPAADRRIEPRTERLCTWAGLFGALAIASFSPLVRGAIAGEWRSDADGLSKTSPVVLASFLAGESHPHWGNRPEVPLRILNSFRWGDYLLWRMPPTDAIYIYTHVHCYDPQRLTDLEYIRLLEPAPNDWKTKVDRYRINAIAMQAEPRCRLFDELRAGTLSKDWTIVYDDFPDRPVAGPDLEGKGILAMRRLDPFTASLAAAQSGQAALGGLGMVPLASSASFLSHLQWHWAK